MLPLNLYARVRVLCAQLHARPRVQRAPGLPCALCFRGREVQQQTLGGTAPRDREGVLALWNGIRKLFRRRCERRDP